MIPFLLSIHTNTKHILTKTIWKNVSQVFTVALWIVVLQVIFLLFICIFSFFTMNTDCSYFFKRQRSMFYIVERFQCKWLT